MNPSLLSEEELSRQAAALEAEVRGIRQAGKFLLFQPLPHQRPFFESKKPIRLFFGSNRSGKSETGTIAMLSACLGTPPLSLGGRQPRHGWGENKLPHHRYVLAGESFSVIADTIVPKLRQYVVPEMLLEKPRRNQAHLDYLWRFRSGAELVIMSYDQGREAFEGWAAHGVWFDEPPPQDILNAARRGLMETRGFLLVTATLLKNPYLWDDFALASEASDSVMKDVVDYWVADIHANCTECSGGHLPHDWIMSWAESLPPSERQARIHGQPSHLGGIEFPYVSRESHVVADFSPPREWPIVEVVDPASTRGLYVIWACCDPKDYWYVFKAVHVAHGSFSEMCRDLTAHRQTLPSMPVKAVMDARGGGHVVNMETEETWFTCFRRYGLSYEPSHETPMQTLHDWLRPEWLPNQDRPTPKLRLTATVARMDKGPLWALERFQWDPNASKPRQYTQAGKDWVDVMRYLAGFPQLNWQRFQVQSGSYLPPPTIAESYQTHMSRSRSFQDRLWLPDVVGRRAYRYSTVKRRGRVF